MKNLYARRNCFNEMKPERIAAAEAAGVTILDYLKGDTGDRDGLHLSECRPRGFKGCRTSEDPADTTILQCVDGKYTVLHQFKDFDRALKTALRLVERSAT